LLLIQSEEERNKNTSSLSGKHRGWEALKIVARLLVGGLFGARVLMFGSEGDSSW
jgi:hypothetical protein